jgi:hypothetical protein
MLIQKNVKTSFLLNAGRDRTTANGWAASYQLLDKSGNVIFPVGGGYTTQDLQEIGNGLYGVAITFSTTYCGFIRWRITNSIETLYTVEPYTILSSFGNKTVEQTYIANYGKSRTGKSVDFRILKDDLTEERTWNNTGLIELGSGVYGVAVQINTVMTGYIQWRNNTDGLYVSDPVLIFDSLNAPIIQTGSLAVSLDRPGIDVSVNTPEISTTVNQVNVDFTVDETDINTSLNTNIGVSIS